LNIGKILRSILLFSGIAFTITLAVTAYVIGSAPGSFDSPGKDAGSFTYDNSCDYIIHNGLIYESGKEYFRAYSLKDKSEVWEMGQTLNDPVQAVLNGELIVFEKFGPRIQKIENGKAVRTLTLEAGIIYDVIEANKNLLGVICHKDGYKTSLILIDKAFTVVFERAYGEAFIADAVFVSKNQICILLNTILDEEIKSYIEIVDINTGNVVYSKTLGNTLFLKTVRLNGNAAAILSGKEIYIIDSRYNETAHIYLGDNETIYDICVTNGGLLVLIGEQMAGYDSLMKALRIESLDASGNILYSFDTDNRIEKVSYDHDKIIGISSSDIFMYDTAGQVLYNTSSDDIIEKIIGYKGRYYFFHIDRIEEVIPRETKK
jgi:hypothetical protein